MPENLIVVGAGGFGRETLDVVTAINAASPRPRWRLLGVIDDAPSEFNRARLATMGARLIGRLNDANDLLRGSRYVVAVGSPTIRAGLAEATEARGAQPATLVHPAAIIGSSTSLGEGSIVCGGTQVSTNVRLGSHVHVNPGAIIGHDSCLDDFVSINPGAIVSGNVRIASGTLIGAGATILQGLSIGSDAVVGAAACVTHDVESSSTVYGVPARRH